MSYVVVLAASTSVDADDFELHVGARVELAIGVLEDGVGDMESFMLIATTRAAVSLFSRSSIIFRTSTILLSASASATTPPGRAGNCSTDFGFACLIRRGEHLSRLVSFFTIVARVAAKALMILFWYRKK